MALKEIIDKAAVVGGLVREAVVDINSLNNRWNAATIHLAKLLAEHGLSGGVVPDNAANQARITDMATSVPVPTDAEINAACGDQVTAADRATIKLVIRTTAVLRFALRKASEAMPSNDV